ncbi:exosortase A [Rhodoferax sediminis]|uniref:Exosortase A n=1 Tax=Rhodoferax sediminis TaxID=2509614 RepID=A0A515DAU9_9BURK|nr:exosortase A [Rhodoferax sediminis]QDL37534.1 exosortase A [Rhodoferax sediminis]
MNLTASLHPPKDNARLAPPWRHALSALLLLLAWVLFLYRDTGIAMVTIWARSETFTHAFLVPPITLWLIWRQRQRMAGQAPQPAPGVVLLAACVVFGWLLGDLVAVNAVTQLALVSLLVLAVPAVLGWPVTRLILFPLGFLFFAVPIGEFVMPQLMVWTADFTVSALRLSGVPVYREGLQFVIPSGSWSVIEACSGVRYLIASLTVGTLFAYLNYYSTKRRVLFVMVSILVPVIANWIRAYMIVMLANLSGNKLAVGVDHLIYGWLFFGFVIMTMFTIGIRWAEPDKSDKTIEAEKARQSTAPPFSPAKLWTITACFALLAALPHIALWSIDRAEGNAQVSLTAPRALAGDWHEVPQVGAGFKPAFHNPSAEINSSYASQDHTVGLYVGYYRHQDYDRKLVSSSNVLVVSKDPQWAQVASGSRSITVGGQTVDVRAAELRGTDLYSQVNPPRLVAWQIYWVNGTLTASDYLAKAYSAFYRLTGRGDDSAVIIVYSPKNQAGGAEAALASFLATNYTVINELLLKTRQQ